MSPRWGRGDTEVAWLAGGLFVGWRGAGVLLDAPPGVADALAQAGLLGAVRAVGLSGGRARSTGGLIALLCALEPWRRRGEALPVHAPLGDERGPRLVEAWMAGWGERYPVSLDSAAPETGFELGRLRVETLAVPRAEARWLPSPEVSSASGLAFRVRTPDALIAFVPGAAPSDRARRAALGADLAVVEAGVEVWPVQGRFRLDASEAAQVGAGAQEAWLVGDDGRPLPAPEA